MSQVLFTTDYRSPPCGIGTITLENGDMILIQDSSPHSPVKEGIYKEIIVIPYDSGSENYRKAEAELQKILKEKEVTIVHDSELSYEIGLNGKVMTLEQYLAERFSYGY